ncbi:hypothetical protein CUJ83_10100 [Methanocella sp. CWC-04]|uniref:PAS domain S-box-containing protein n=1 Tax=Methanooceanicella nereidis TaxID=2052831 RepID=A0AAP2RD38_9EURY|nr:ATP-binding protein [Methanocella sp. CWC-04]MCD1295351.1 hypothetical protein [Methanocella sp. CWC-04]
MISVLLVDNQPEFPGIVKGLLEHGGNIEVNTAGSVKMALEHLKEKTYDVIISNYDMPGTDGIEFLKALRSRGDNTPFILYASRGREDAIVEAMKSGAEFFLQKSADPEAQFAELRYIVEEIAKRKRAEDLLRRREKDFHAIVNKNADAMVVLDKNGIIRYVNPAAVSLFNLSGSELVGQMLGFPVVLKEPVEMYVLRGFKEFVAAEMRMVEVEWEDRPSYLISFRDVTGHVKYEEELSKARNGLEVRVQERTRELLTANENLRKEIEERKAAEEELRVEIEERARIETELEASKKQAEFYLDLMGHDINNLNQIALGYLELAQESSDMEEMMILTQKPLEVIRSVSQIIQNVKKLQRMTVEEKEKEVKTANAVDLCSILSELQSQYSGRKGKDVKIHLKAPPLCYVMANELINEVFSNLLDNAIKHSNPDKSVTIDIKLKPIKESGKEYYMCTVEDNGPGIPDWVKDKIFMRFQRGATKAHGKGIGLYIVKKLVEDYHGDVWVEDRVPGDYSKGARFVVMLPAVK